MSEETFDRDAVKAQLTELGVPFSDRARDKTLAGLLEAQAHVVTEEDLEANPSMREEGIEVGETIYVPYEEEASEDAADDSSEGDAAVVEAKEAIIDVGDLPDGAEAPADGVQDEGEANTEEVEEESEPDMSEPTETEEYEVVTGIKMMGTYYVAGDRLRVNPEDASRFLRQGAIKR